MLAYILIAACAAGLSLLMTPFVRRLAFRVGAVDYPGERKIHAAPVPRLGGVSVVMASGLTALAVLALDRPFAGHLDAALGVRSIF